jgi:hypothetical protein
MNLDELGRFVHVLYFVMKIEDPFIIQKKADLYYGKQKWYKGLSFKQINAYIAQF